MTTYPGHCPDCDHRTSACDTRCGTCGRQLIDPPPPPRATTARGTRALNDRQRWAAVAGLLVGLYAISQMIMPFDKRYGRYEFQTKQCPAPLLQLTQARFDSRTGLQSVCWSSSMNRVVTGVILMGVAALGTLAIIRLLGAEN